MKILSALEVKIEYSFWIDNQNSTKLELVNLSLGLMLQESSMILSSSGDVNPGGVWILDPRKFFDIIRKLL